MSSTNYENTMCFSLMMLIVCLIQESGAREEEAIAALKLSEVLIPELGLQKRATIVIQT
jgi:hypothetical protein